MEYFPTRLLLVPLEGFIAQPAPIACSTCHTIPTEAGPPLGLCPHCAKVGYCSRECQR